MRDRQLGSPRPGDAPESGTALPLVLITIAVLALVVATVTSGSSQELRMSRAFVRSNQAYDAALAGIQQLAARCASGAASCNPSGGNLSGNLSYDHTAYQVVFGSCQGAIACQPPQPGMQAISVVAVGCTLPPDLYTETTCNFMATQSTASFNQGRRVLNATIFFGPPGSGQSTFKLLP